MDRVLQDAKDGPSQLLLVVHKLWELIGTRAAAPHPQTGALSPHLGAHGLHDLEEVEALGGLPRTHARRNHCSGEKTAAGGSLLTGRQTAASEGSHSTLKVGDLAPHHLTHQHSWSKAAAAARLLTCIEGGGLGLHTIPQHEAVHSQGMHQLAVLGCQRDGRRLRLRMGQQRGRGDITKMREWCDIRSTRCRRVWTKGAATHPPGTSWPAFTQPTDRTVVHGQDQWSPRCPATPWYRPARVCP